MKKLLLLPLSIVGGSLLFTSCSHTNSNINGDLINPSNPSHISVNREKTMAYQAISSLESISFNSPNVLAKFKNGNEEGSSSNVETSEDVPSTPADPVEPDKKDDLQTILEQIDLMINTNKDQLKIEIVESDRDEYETKQLVTYVDIDQSSKNLTLYYNSTVEEETEVEDDEDKAPEEEYEKETKLEGIIVKDDKELLFDSELEIEKESDEQEQELKMNIYLTADKKNIIRCLQEYETEIEDGKEEKEEKYSYTKIENGKKVSFYSFTREVEDDETEIKLVRNGQTHKIKMYEKNGKTFVRVALKVNGKETKVTLYEKVIDEVTNEITYVEVK